MRCACGTHASAQVSAHASAHAVPMQCTRAGVGRPTLERELAECRHPKEQPHRSPSRGSSVASTDERPNRFLSRRASRVPRSAQRARRANALAARASRPRSLATAPPLPSPLRAPATVSSAVASAAAASPAAASPAAASPAASPVGLRGRPRLRVALKVSEDSCSEAPRPSAASPSVRIVSCRVACHRSVRTDAHAVYMCELQSRLAGKAAATHGWCVPWVAPRNAQRTALRRQPCDIRYLEGEVGEPRLSPWRDGGGDHPHRVAREAAVGRDAQRGSAGEEGRRQVHLGVGRPQSESAASAGPDSRTTVS